MSNLYQIISQFQKDLYCPVCGKKFEFGEIRLRALFDRTLIIQTICKMGHITIFITSFQKKQDTPVLNNDVQNLHSTLLNFDGDFKKLWKN